MAKISDDELRKKIEELAISEEKIEKEELFNWFKKRIEDGLEFGIIAKKLEEANYDLDKANKLLGINLKAEKALEEIKKLKEEMSEKKEKEEKTKLFSWLIGAFLTSGIGAFIAITIKRATSQIEGNVPGFEFIYGFIKAGWAICIIAGIAALVILGVIIKRLVKK